MNLLSSIWNYKCPRCRKEDFFVSPFNLQKPLKMHEKCSHCEQVFEQKSAYYYGAMMISYIWIVCACLAIAGFCMLVLDWSVEGSFLLILIVSALSYFFILRISRSMYVHMDIKYEKELGLKPE